MNPILQKLFHLLSKINVGSGVKNELSHLYHRNTLEKVELKLLKIYKFDSKF